MLTTTYTVIAPPHFTASHVLDHRDTGYQEFLDSIMPVCGIAGILTIQVDRDGATVASDTIQLSELVGDRLDIIETLTYMQHRTEVRASLAAGLTRREATECQAEVTSC